MEMSMGDEDVRTVDQKCGIGRFRPKCLQGCARIGAFVGVYSISALLTQTLMPYVYSQVSMLEKTFGFSSSETGFLVACNDIGFLTASIFVGYLAKKVHIPRGLGITTMIFGVCGILCAFPYFLQDHSVYDLRTKNDKEDHQKNLSETNSAIINVPMCDFLNGSGRHQNTCALASKEEEAALEQLWVKHMAYVVIAVGMGAVKAPRFPFMTLYIDDSVQQKKTGLYCGIIYTAFFFGPVTALLVGSAISSIYVTLESVSISATDPRWISAWWLGFLVFGLCSIVFSIPIWCFPRNLRSKNNQDKLETTEDILQLHTSRKNKKRCKEAKDFASSFARIYRNPVYCFLMAAAVVRILGTAGVLSFVPKYIEKQYNLPLWKANMLTAIFGILPVTIGSFIGSVITRRVKMTPLTTCKMVIAFYSIQMVTIIAGFFLGCDQPVLYGSNNFSTSSPLYKMTENPCGGGCSCDENNYFPICGDDGRSYFSPCHAGCSSKDLVIFSNCSCIEAGHAATGLCDQHCSIKLYIYAAVNFVGNLVTAFNVIPSYVAEVRSVERRDRGLATAYQGFLISALGWVPGPMIFGAIIDNTCSLWKYKCGERQSCSIYDIEYFRIILHAYKLAFVALTTLIIGCVYLYFKSTGQKTWKGEEDESIPNQNRNDVNETENSLKL